VNDPAGLLNVCGQPPGDIVLFTVTAYVVMLASGPGNVAM
jgi:hypothetical protein